ncbi:MAG: tetratricopeptide repeat protein [Devosia sp.]
MKQLAAALLLLVVSPALAAQGPSERAVIDNSMALDNTLPTPESGTSDALAISRDIFTKTDEAFGAFQRGFFLTALALALPRAEQADPAAQTLIAEIYAKGLGVSENLARASSWYALAAKNGDRMAAFELGLLYLNGDGVPKNRARAGELFKQAADKGYPPAEYNLALLHVVGTDVSPSLSAAATLMKSAADAGLAEAQYDYGSMLLEGAGVAPNPAEGVRQIGLAAGQGLIEAEIDYATQLYLGQGIEKNLKEAVGWYERAANAGNPVAQNRYAKLLAAGEGVDVDLKQAAMWRALSRRQGLTDPLLDKLLATISQDDLNSAEELARFWPTRPPTAEDVAAERAREKAAAASVSSNKPAGT